VEIWAGSRRVGQATAGLDWANVARFYPYAGSAHAWDWRGLLPAGSYRLCVRAVDVGPGTSKDIGCRTVAVEGDPLANPKGNLAAVTASSSTVVAKGWTFDPDVPTSPLTVSVFVDGRKQGDVTADDEYWTVGEYYPEAGSAHGFSWSGELADGRHEVCAYAVNKRYGTANTLLGCKDVTVTATAPAQRATSLPSESAAPEPVAPASPAPSSGRSTAPSDTSAPPATTPEPEAATPTPTGP
jgi:hypothetical protein